MVRCSGSGVAIVALAICLSFGSRAAPSPPVASTVRATRAAEFALLEVSSGTGEVEPSSTRVSVAVLGWSEDASSFAFILTQHDHLCGTAVARLVDAAGRDTDRVQAGHCDLIGPRERELDRLFAARIQGWLDKQPLYLGSSEPDTAVDGGALLKDTASTSRGDRQGRSRGWKGRVYELGPRASIRLRTRFGKLLGKVRLEGGSGIVVPVASPVGKQIAWIIVRQKTRAIDPAEREPGKQYVDAVVITPSR